MSDEGKVKYDPELEIRNLQNQISELKVENSRLKEVIRDNELEDEVEIDCTSIEEGICINGINHISLLVRDQQYDKKDVESFEKLYNILRSIRGKAPAGKKKVKGEIADLLKIVEKK